MHASAIGRRLLIPALLLAMAGAHAQAPTVTAITPAHNAISAPRTATVELSFSQMMSPATASGAAIRIHGSQTGARTGTFSGGSTAGITWRPTHPWRAGETVRVSVVASEAKNLAGVPMTQSRHYSFTAAAAPSTGRFVPGWQASGAIGEEGYAYAADASGDMDGDGDVDLLLTNPIGVQLNNGAGAFTPGPTIWQYTAPTTLAVSDLDQDGDLDVVAFGANAGIYVLHNDGQANLTLVNTIPVCDFVYSVTTADLNSDGFPDIAVAGATGGLHGRGCLSVRFNAGNGTAFAGPDLLRPTASSDLALVRTADLDADGDVDLVANNRRYQAIGADSLHVWLNGGNGQFQAQRSLRCHLHSMEALRLADFNGDGSIDMLSPGYRPRQPGSPDSCGLEVYWNDGMARFNRLVMPIQNGPYQLFPFYFSADDLDGDADMDLLFGGGSFSQTFLNSGDGLFTPGNATWPAVGVLSGGSLTTADVDGNGTIDIIQSVGGLPPGPMVFILLNVASVGIPEEVAGSFTLCPNPAHTCARVTLPGAAAPQIVQVLDALGRAVLPACPIASGQREAVVPLAGLAPGLYTVRVGKMARRLVVE